MFSTQIEEQVTKRIVQIIASFWILMKMMSIKLWVKERNYPVVPVIDLPAAMHIVLLGLFFVLAAWLIWKPDNRKAMTALIVTEIITTLADQNRLQPWHYQYVFTFFALAANGKKTGKALQAIALICVATYLFSGLQKLHSGFINSVWSVHILKNFMRLPDHIIHNRFVHAAGYIIPAIEIGGSLGLLYHKTMKAAAYSLIGMHIFLLWFLGPLGINYNTVVWPWNVQMVMLLHLLFIRNKILLNGSLFASAANIIVAFFWLVMPVFGLFGYWDKFLSSAMYAGKTRLKQYYFEDRATIPAELKKYAFYSKTNASARIVITDWSVQELNVAAVTEPRMLRSITRQLNERYASQKLKFEVTEADY